MFTHTIDPVLLNLGPLQIRYYGLFYVIGFFLAYFIIRSVVKSRKLVFTNERIEDMIVYGGVGSILGARIFYVLVYNFAFYLHNPLEIFAVWHGGLSVHGSFIGGLIGLYYFSRKYQFNYLEVLDLSVVPIAFGLGLGRIGNFINGELYGRITSVPWCVNFPGVVGCRHPSQLYESLYSFFIFGILWSLRNKKMKKGTLAATFVLLYSSLRFFTEFFREADPQIGYIYGLTLGQIINILMFIIGLVFLSRINKDIKGQ